MDGCCGWLSDVKSRTDEKETEAVNSTPRVERYDDTSSTPYLYKLRGDDVILSSITSSDADITTASLTSYAPAVPEDTRISRTNRLLQVPDPGERWHHATRRQHGGGVARQQRAQQDVQKMRSAVVVISSVFFALTVFSTLGLGIFCRKRNTVFVLQKCEQRDYAAAADDDNDGDDDELSTDCDSTTSPTIVTHSEVERRRDLNRASAAPKTPDLSLFCTSQTGKRNITGSGSVRRDKMSRRAVCEMRSSWIELCPSTTLSTILSVDDSDDDIEYRVRRDVMSASSLFGCNDSRFYDGDVSRFQRSTSLDADVSRRVLTCGAVSSWSRRDSTTTWPGELHDCHVTSNCTVPCPSREVAAGDVTDADHTYAAPPTIEQSMGRLKVQDLTNADREKPGI